MKIAIVSRGVPDDNDHMNGIFEFDQAKALVAFGHTVILVVLDLRSFLHKRKYGFISYIKDGVIIEKASIPCGKLYEYLYYQTGTWAFHKLYEIVQTKYGQPDIVHAHFANYGYMAAKALGNHDVPLVITEHSSRIIEGKFTKRELCTEIYAYNKAAKIIAVSPALQKKIKNICKKDVVCIPNMIDCNKFKYTDVSVNKYRIVAVGNLIKRKRMDLLIRAFVEAFKEIPQVELSIIGEGSERVRLENLIAEKGMQGKIFLKGEKNRNEIIKELQGAAFFVLPSASETFGVVYIEALACGVPVIATKCGGPESFVNSENGIMVEVDNMAELANAMKNMWQNQNTYDRRLISAKIKEKFSSDKISELLSKVYEELLKDRSR